MSILYLYHCLFDFDFFDIHVSSELYMPLKYDEKYDMNLKNTYIKMKIERKITTIEIHTISIIKNAKDLNGPNLSMFYRK